MIIEKPSHEFSLGYGGSLKDGGGYKYVTEHHKRKIYSLYGVCIELMKACMWLLDKIISLNHNLLLHILNAIYHITPPTTTTHYNFTSEVWEG